MDGWRREAGISSPSLLNVCVTDGATVVATRVVLGEGKAASLYFTSGSAWVPRRESRRAASGAGAVAAIAHGAAVPDIEFCMEQSDRRERVRSGWVTRVLAGIANHCPPPLLPYPTRQAVIVASERLTLSAEDWLPVPPSTMLVVHPHGPVLLVPVRLDDSSVATLPPPAAVATTRPETSLAASSGAKRRRHSFVETIGPTMLARACSAEAQFIVTAADLSGAAAGAVLGTVRPKTTGEDSRRPHTRRGGSHLGGCGVAAALQTPTLAARSTPAVLLPRNPSAVDLEPLVLAAAAASAPPSSPALRVQMYCAGKSFEQQTVAVSADDEFTGEGSEAACVMRCTGVPVADVLSRPRGQRVPEDSLHKAAGDVGAAPVDRIQWLHRDLPLSPLPQLPRIVLRPRSSHAASAGAAELHKFVSADRAAACAVPRLQLAAAVPPTGTPLTTGRLSDQDGATLEFVRGIPAGPVPRPASAAGCWLHPALIEAVECGPAAAAAFRPLTSRGVDTAARVFAADDTFGNLTPHVFGDVGASTAAAVA